MRKICAFFGHREIPENLAPQLQAAIRRAICEFGITEFWDGGYGQFDNLAAETVAQLKEEYPHIILRLIRAYPPKYSGTPTPFDSSHCPSFLDQFPGKWRIPRRNLYMAEQCDLAICYVTHAESTIHEPLDHIFKEKPIINLGDYQAREPISPFFYGGSD